MELNVALLWVGPAIDDVIYSFKFALFIFFLFDVLHLLELFFELFFTQFLDQP